MIQVVIVLYKTDLQSCTSFNSFKSYAEHLSVPYDILIVNNYPSINIENGNGYTVHTPSSNIMLAGAYNKAMDEAKRNKHKWLLLLDQDTVVTEEYMKEIDSTFTEGVDDRIAAIVPIVRQATNNIQISPATYNPFWGLVGMKMLSQGITNSCVSAINSCSVIRVEAVDSIGGFPEKFPLDGLDIIYFYKFFQKGWSFQVIESVIYQNLSVYDYKHSMNKDRYQSIIRSELDLAKEMGVGAIITTRLRYCVRTIRQLLDRNKKAYSGITFKAIFYR